jgi:glycine/D-amino acid oxidase-like deaminating enzyme/nitrite reductase/ring-hydroxylating ferredoxin subunit
MDVHDNRLLPGEPQSLWLATTGPFAAEGSLPTEADVAIVGAGIVGIAAAYQLRDKGLKVVVIEAGGLASGVTGNTTGKLTSQHGLRYARLKSTFGIDKARQYADANEWALTWARGVAFQEGIACDFAEASANVFSLTGDDHEAFAEELFVCKELGLHVSFAESEDMPMSAAAVLRFAGQARFHPRKFLLGLADRAREAGVQFVEGVRVTSINPGDIEHELVTEKGSLRAKHVIVATHYPIFDSGFFVAKLTPRRSYAIAAVVRGRLPEGMYITHGEPMHSFRQAKYNDKDVMIIGGGHHKVGQDDNTGRFYRDLEDWARRTFDVERILFRWSTQDNATPDGLPYVGRSPGQKSIYVATGFDGWGMSNGLVSGRILADVILNTENPWAEAYEPSRMEIQAVPKMVVENLNVAGHLIGDKLASVPPGNPEGLARNEGAVLDSKFGRICAFRDDHDQLFVVDAACTHMGCQLHWNSAERSWDCPCHGSRFAPDGKVLQGPATTPLKAKTFEEA